MTYINNTPRLTLVRENAKNARNQIDFGVFDEEAKLKQLTKHYEDCIYHPTTGLIARERYLGNLKKLPLNRNDKIKYLSDILKERINQFYPTTKKARQYIIETHRISFDHVRPSRGYNILDKIKILLKR
jgi:hypothetical protein